MRLHAPARRQESSIDSVRGLAIVLVLSASLSIAAVAPARAADDTGPKTGPSAEGALAAEQELARAMQANDAAGIERLLADDWAVIATTGGVGEGKSIFADGIKSGYLTRKTFEISEPRVRLYGNIAVVTTKVKTSGTFQGKPFDVSERQTDVLRWQHGAWKVVLTHETKLAPQ
jgi:ketosteroid isomerase-like protein